MSVLICMASYCTNENNRLEYASKTIKNLLDTVDLYNHTLAVYMNSPNSAALNFYNGINKRYNELNINIIHDTNNVGTANAINALIHKYRIGNQPIIKMDDDVIVSRTGWVDRMEEAIQRDSKIGVLGLKRVDLEQSPDNQNSFFRTEMRMLPHERGQRWIAVEKSHDIMGTCTMLSPSLFSAVGYYKQPNEYGYDDSDMNVRSLLSGHYNAFLCNEDIDHIDTGENKDYFEFKQRRASDGGGVYQKWISDYKLGIQPLYHNPFE